MILLLILVGLKAQVARADFQVRYSNDKKAILVFAQKGKSQTTIELPKGFFVNGEPKLYQSDNFALVYSEVSDHVVYSTRIYAFNAEAKNIWKRDLKSFNPSTPLIEDEFVFVAFLGLVMKLQKLDGQLAWKHDGLYENASYAFNGESEITRRGPFVAFAKNVVVDDRSGNLIEVQK